jgi:misacylated tRNA(Ala) deacylase
MRDNYIREFDATVVDLTNDSIVLDKTAFYPEGGGQLGDKGTLSFESVHVPVVDTKKRDGRVYHITSEKIPFSIGNVVRGSIDWQQRYELMRFHTAQHILSRYLQMNYGLETVGNQISHGSSRADYSPIEQFDDEMKQAVTLGVNEIISSGLEVQIAFMPRERAINYLREKGYQYRYVEMVPKSVREFRIITIGDYDAASCAGTHVANTKEIGAISIGKTKNVGAGKRRLYFSFVQ